jgi:hypothetical protein
MPHKIAMIGDGNVGSALTNGLTRAGYEVRAVGKEPGRVKETAAWGDVIVLAVPFAERENALREMGDAYHGKPIVDVTNAIEGESFAASVERSGAGGEDDAAEGDAGAAQGVTTRSWANANARANARGAEGNGAREWIPHPSTQTLDLPRARARPRVRPVVALAPEHRAVSLSCSLSLERGPLLARDASCRSLLMGVRPWTRQRSRPRGRSCRASTGCAS